MQSIAFVIAVAGVTYAIAGYQRTSPRTIALLPERVNTAGRVVRAYDVHALVLRHIADANDRFENAPPATMGQNQSIVAAPVDVESDPGENLSDLVRSNVRPNSWAEVGGAEGTIRYAAGMLIVEQTADGQKEVADLLKMLDSHR